MLESIEKMKEFAQVHARKTVDVFWAQYEAEMEERLSQTASAVDDRVIAYWQRLEQQKLDNECICALAANQNRIAKAFGISPDLVLSGDPETRQALWAQFYQHEKAKLQAASEFIRQYLQPQLGGSDE